MFRSRRRAIGIALLMILPLILAACSTTGGKKAAQGGGSSVAAGHANTPSEAGISATVRSVSPANADRNGVA